MILHRIIVRKIQSFRQFPHSQGLSAHIGNPVHDLIHRLSLSDLVIKRFHIDNRGNLLSRHVEDHSGQHYSIILLLF